MAEAALEERMAKIEGAFTQIDQRLARVETELTEVRAEIRNLSRLIISVLIPMWVTIVGAILAVALR